MIKMVGHCPTYPYDSYAPEKYSGTSEQQTSWDIDSCPLFGNVFIGGGLIQKPYYLYCMSH